MTDKHIEVVGVNWGALKITEPADWINAVANGDIPEWHPLTVRDTLATIVFDGNHTREHALALLDAAGATARNRGVELRQGYILNCRAADRGMTPDEYFAWLEEQSHL